MNLYESELWLNDVRTGMDAVPELDNLAEKKILITGAAGLILSALTDILFTYNETHEKKIEVYVAGRWPEEMRSRFGPFCDKWYYHFVKYDASRDDNIITEKVDYIIHGASNAYPALIMKEPVETMLSNFTGLVQLLNYAKACESKRVLYISSSEVYGAKNTEKPYQEDEYGYIDLLNARNSYSIGKRAAETLCCSFSTEYNLETVIVRPGHIYGPTASPNDNRVSSAFAFDAANGKNLVLKSDGSQIRSYCYCIDCATAILKVLLCGENKNAYNISNPDSIISIKQMAELLSEAGNVKLTFENASKEEKKGFNPMSNSSLNSDKLQSIGWRGCFDSKTGLFHTVSILKALTNK